MYESELTQIGLTEKEAKVYLAALELGKATAQEVSNKAGLKRPTTYFTMDLLMEKGLMSSIHEGKKQYFMAETPDRLVDVLHKREDELRREGDKLKQIIPSLKKICPIDDGGPVVKYYSGREGALSMVKNLMDFKGDEVWIAYPHDKVAKLFSKEELDQIKFSRIKKKVRIKGLYTSLSTELEDNETTNRIRLNIERYSLPADIAVYGDNVRLISFDDDTVGVVIKNKDIAETMKTLFELAWKGLS